MKREIFGMLGVRKGAVCLVVFTLVLGGTAISTWISTTGVAQEESPLILAWVDMPNVLGWRETDYLTRNISSIARWCGATYSPTKDYIWILVETTSDKIPELANITNVLNVAIAEESEWKWDLWWNYRKISPILELQAKRMRAEYPNEKIEVNVWFETTSDPEASLNNTISLVESLGGNVIRIGVLESEGEARLIVSIPIEAIDVLATYNSIQEILERRPLI